MRRLSVIRQLATTSTATKAKNRPKGVFSLLFLNISEKKCVSLRHQAPQQACAQSRRARFYFKTLSETYLKRKTMSLYTQIESDIKAAMLAKDKLRLQALRGIKKEFIEAKTAPGCNGELSDETAIKILVKMAKQRRESARIYTEQNRPELAADELAEVEVIEAYLPKALTEDELRAELEKIIEQTGAASPAEMGKVMGVATKALAGRADGKAISAMVRQLLAK